MRVDVGGGVRLAYRVAGAPDAEPMVLLHGLSSSGASWQGVVEALAESHRVYAPDLRGHGASDWPGTYSFELMRDDILGFLDALGLDSVVLVGHSMGGTLALLVAEEHPDRVSRLIIEDAPPPYPGRDPLPPPQRPDRELTFDWPVFEAIIGQLNAPDPAWWERVPELPVRALVIAGGPASYVPQDLLIKLVELMPDCESATVPIGHHIHRDRPDEFVAVVRKFLNT